MQKLSINVSKIPRDKIKPGKNGQYVDLVLFENRNGPDQYGNDGFVALDVTKAEREAGEKGPIVGNWKHLGTGAQKATSAPLPTRPKPAPPAPSKRPADPDLDAADDDLPF